MGIRGNEQIVVTKQEVTPGQPQVPQNPNPNPNRNPDSYPFKPNPLNLHWKP